jgi:hypothetical protein
MAMQGETDELYRLINTALWLCFPHGPLFDYDNIEAHEAKWRRDMTAELTLRMIDWLAKPYDFSEELIRPLSLDLRCQIAEMTGIAARMLNDPRFRDEAIRNLEDSEGGHVMLRVIAQLRDPSAIPALADLVTAATRGVAYALADALETTCSVRAMPLLRAMIELWRTKDFEVAEHCYDRMLAISGDPVFWKDGRPEPPDLFTLPGDILPLT